MRSASGQRLRAKHRIPLITIRAYQAPTHGDKVYLVHDADDPYYHIAEQYCPNHIPEHVALHPAWILRVRSLMVGEQLSRLEKKQGACYQPTIAVVRPTNSSSKNHA